MDDRRHFRIQGAFTDPGRHAGLFDALPDDIAGLVRVVQGLMVYDVVAEPLYGHKLTPAQAETIHLRRVEDMLGVLMGLEKAPLGRPRAFQYRLAGRCHHYALLLTSMLRAKGIAARERGGFAAYFNAPKFEDHWVVEYWCEVERRWILADAQLDPVWMERVRLQGEPLDLAAGDFIVAAEAWRRCREDGADPDTFGISFVPLFGLWFILGSLMRDVAALNKVELLPWDFWGAMPRPNSPLGPDELALGDRLAALTADPDSSADGLQRLYNNDARLRVDNSVFNGLRNCDEPIHADQNDAELRASA